MTAFEQAKYRNTLMGRLSYGCDLLEELTNIAVKNQIALARVEAIGAVQKAVIAYYDQKTLTYQSLSFDYPLELIKLSGNISLKDGNPFVHAHVTLSDESGKSLGGHLASGTIVFSCEFSIDVYDGPALTRGLDQQTGLQLWLM
ncbi:MAG TPA: PPC domain-containing DNA-binding protein [Bacteroidales bacterium]|nr:PPC domain-containing DNA-binding protein [Bacteroidales bacterium]